MSMIENIHQYKILSLIGEGAFGKVFKVKDTHTNKILALKLLNLTGVPFQLIEETKYRFEGEYECGKLESPFIIKTYDLGKYEKTLYFTMDYHEKGDLTELLGSEWALQNQNQICQQLLLGLQTLHSNGIIHRDLKPSNLLLDDQFNVVISDLGAVGNLIQRITKKNVMGHAQRVFLTQLYASPEFLLKRVRFSATCGATDIFSLGILLTQIITGYLPHGEVTQNTDMSKYFEKKQNGLFQLPSQLKSGVNSCIDEIVKRCLQPEVRHRPRSVTELLKLLPGDSPFETQFKSPINQNQIKLEIVKGQEKGKFYQLRDKQLFTLGRDVDPRIINDIAIKDDVMAFISRSHATFEFHPDSGTWYIRDGQFHQEQGWSESKNGTLVNSSRVDKNGIALHDGDTITVGDTTLKVIT